MIVLKAQFTIASDAKAEFLRHMAALVAASRAESGCQLFACYADTEQLDQFIVLQEWESEAALNQHEASAHVADFKQAARSLIVSREPTKVYHIERVTGL